MNKAILSLAILSAVFLAACEVPKSDSEFRQMCQANKHMWMLMEPMKDGQEMDSKDCLGCMPDAKNHICSKEEYIKYMEGTAP